MIPTDLEAYWLPFTSNRYFKRHPKMLVSAKGAYYRTEDGRELFDCISGMWCCPIGHGHPKIVEAVRRQVETLDYSPAFQIGNAATFRLAERIAELAPPGLDHVFFSNSGSEAVDTALKIALAYHRVRGEAGRFRMIGRERAYHGVGFGGISVGGMAANRRAFASAMLPGVDHLPHTWEPALMAFSRGQPSWGGHLADDLERLVALHDASTIAAVIVEPVQGSTGVLVPPQGYLERLREICTRHGILLIFDEVITGFGRLGESFGAQRLGVVPDLITFAKAVTNGTIPMGGVIVRGGIYEAFMSAQAPAYATELFHGYTYSGHPMAAAAGLAALDVYQQEGLFQRSRELEPVLEAAVHDLRGEPGVVDVRNFGLTAGVDLEAFPGQPGLRALRVFEHGYQNDQLFRVTGDTVALGPPFISTPAQIDRMVEALRAAIRAVKAD
ncbi:MAG TPA: aspartate aminotransferase family protein [Rhodocyclaceae bacterium]|nr:aspartate aminotransferase family protein [Rhodocyclaceae bacterium]